MALRMQCAVALMVGLVPLAVQAEAADRDATRAAVIKSLALLEKSAAEYTKHRTCFSCHHQAMPVLAFTTAKTLGFDINDKEVERQTKWTAEFLAKNAEQYREGRGQGGQADTAGYALWTLAAGGWKADATTDAVVEYLLLRDKEHDQWLPVSNRPPTEASPFTTTYLALRGLKHYAPTAKQELLKTRLEKARKWLEDNAGNDTEDWAFRLRALDVAGAKRETIAAATTQLLTMQREDGGWSQTAKLDSDAYATGLVLATLHQFAGLKADSEAYQRGVRFLLRTRKEDGSWHILSRSKPFQLYFESGFPHGKDQFISIAASSWATIALAYASAK